MGAFFDPDHTALALQPQLSYFSVCLKEKENNGTPGFTVPLYHHPLPATIETELYLNEIVKIDGDQNSITISIELITYWNDPRIGLSNGNDE